MFAINPYPHDYGDLLRALQQLHADQAHLDALRAVFDQPGKQHRRAKSTACTWLKSTATALRTPRVARKTCYLREWGIDPNAPPKTRQSGTGAGRPRGAPAITDEIKARILTERGAGKSYAEIGGLLNVHAQTVGNVCRAAGVGASVGKRQTVTVECDALIANITRLWQQGATAKEIGGQVGLTYQAVSRIVRANGLTRPEKPPVKPRKTPEQIAAALQQLSAGMSRADVMRETGLSYQAVSKIARQNAQQGAH